MEPSSSPAPQGPAAAPACLGRFSRRNSRLSCDGPSEETGPPDLDLDPVAGTLDPANGGRESTNLC